MAVPQPESFGEPGFRIPGDASPIKLCEICSKLSAKAIFDTALRFNSSTGHGIEHHSGFSTLEASAAGCDMCSAFLERVTTVYCQREKCSPTEAFATFKQAESLGANACLVRRFPLLATSLRSTIEYGVPVEPVDQVSGNWDSKKFIFAQFTLIRCGGKLSAVVGGHGRVLTMFAGYEDRKIPQVELTQLPDWTVARNWIKECIGNEHHKCGNDGREDGSRLLLPTRLIDVGLDNLAQPVLVPANDHTATYVALSHCWAAQCHWRLTYPISPNTPSLSLSSQCHLHSKTPLPPRGIWAIAIYGSTRYA